MTASCEVLSEWMKSNKLKLNAEKTHILTVGTQQKLSSLPRKLEVAMDRVVLQNDNVGYEMLLGCKVQENMKWNQQVEMLLNKLSKRLVGLQNLRLICPYVLRKTITEGLFNSILAYCLHPYGGMDSDSIRCIQSLQNKAARLVCCAPPRSNRVELFRKLDWLTVNQLVVYHTLILVFKIRNNREPEYLFQFLCNDSRNGRIMIPHLTLSLMLRSFCVRGACNWNLLPAQIRTEQKIGIFKKKMRKWILDNTPMFA